MTKISAAAVKALREKTQLPMMKCKWALEQTGGDEKAAIELLRKEGAKFTEQRGQRETSSGRIAVYADLEKGVGAMVELQCETDPVAKNEGFRQLADMLAQQLATGPGAATPEELLSQPAPGTDGETLQEKFNDLVNQIREVFRLPRILRIDAPCGGYAHFTGTLGALVQVEGGTPEAARDVAMHVAAMNPECLVPEQASKEKVAEIEEKYGAINEMALKNALKKYYAEVVLLHQPLVKDPSKTVGQFAEEHGMKVLGYVRWELGGEENRCSL